MSIISRFSTVLHDNPASVNQGATRFSGPMVATAGILLNLFILSLIFPFLLEPDDRDFRAMTESLGFGGLFSLILLGATLVIATVMIPFRLATVFLGPRIGRYFDQIVLSGISPFRLLIGNVTAQINLIGLLLFLLLPHVVLAISFGGFQVTIFLGCLILIVSYCMMLSLCTLWFSLYVNEIVAGLAVVGAVIICGIFGGIPAAPQPMLMTPVPAFLQPVYASIPMLANDRPFDSFWSVFAGCLACMTVISCVAALCIHLGPLYGIVKSNSTFGEVVKPGDASKRKRFRFRLHIQRPSEIAFLYQNRSSFLTRYEGFIRWGLGFSVLLVAIAIVEVLRTYFAIDTSLNMGTRDPNSNRRFAYGFHTIGLVRHGITLVLGILLFSHARNTTLQSVTVFGKKRATVSTLDWTGFICLMLLSSAINIGVFLGLEHSNAFTNGFSLMPPATQSTSSYWNTIDLPRLLYEGTLALNLCGLSAYLMQRWFCQKMWMKLVAFFWTYVAYGVMICGLPILPLLIVDELSYRGPTGPMETISAAIAMISPPLQLAVIGGETSSRIPFHWFWWIFYLSQALLLLVLIRSYRKGNRLLEDGLLDASTVETQIASPSVETTT
ncbi:MAG: hypothetical protein ABJZ55_24710 [Fuerstiella sp.]